MAIYVMQKGKTGNVKVGFSGNLRDRFRRLQHKHGSDLVIRRLFRGTQDDEARLHCQFALFWVNAVPGEKEWFLPVPEILNAPLGLEEIPVPKVGASISAPNNPLTLWRLAKGLPFTAVGELLGIHGGTVNHLEKGRWQPSLEQLHRISVATAGAVTPGMWVEWWIDSEAYRLASANGEGIDRKAARQFISEESKARMSDAATRRWARHRAAHAGEVVGDYA